VHVRVDVDVDVDVDVYDDELWMQMDADKLDGDSGVCARILYCKAKELFALCFFVFKLKVEKEAKRVTSRAGQANCL